MFVSRKMAHALQNRLQLILSLVEQDRASEAIATIHRLSTTINEHIESKDAERDRLAREQI